MFNEVKCNFSLIISTDSVQYALCRTQSPADLINPWCSRRSLPNCSRYPFHYKIVMIPHNSLKISFGSWCFCWIIINAVKLNFGVLTTHLNNSHKFWSHNGNSWMMHFTTQRPRTFCPLRTTPKEEIPVLNFTLTATSPKILLKSPDYNSRITWQWHVWNPIRTTKSMQIVYQSYNLRSDSSRGFSLHCWNLIISVSYEPLLGQTGIMR